MKVLVLGSGVIGTTTAYFLARAGAEVTVIDRQSGPAMETSFANAGQVSPGYSTPWAAPGIPLKALKWLFQKHAPLSLRPDGSLFQLRWLMSMLSQCNGADYATNKERMMRLSNYSRDVLRQLRADTGLSYEERQGGTLQLFRTQAQLDAVQKDIDVLRDCGVPFELLSREQLAGVEPGLADALPRLAGGLRLPDDETGDCHLFSTRLAAMAEAAASRKRSSIGSSLAQSCARHSIHMRPLAQATRPSRQPEPCVAKRCCAACSSRVLFEKRDSK